jgi:hypothetical protein
MNGDVVRAKFLVALKNKVTLKPFAQQRPYLAYSELVQIQRDNGTKVDARVHSNDKDGMIVLRTLPV